MMPSIARGCRPNNILALGKEPLRQGAGNGGYINKLAFSHSGTLDRLLVNIQCQTNQADRK